MNLEHLIVCQFEGCKMIFEHPVTLPCGYSLCKKHLIEYDEKFECSFCHDQHQIPNNGFSTNKTIDLLLESFFEIDPLRKEIRTSFDKLNEIIYEYEKFDPEGYIFDNAGDIINKVDLHREELIKEINEKYDEMITRLKDKDKNQRKYVYCF